MRVKIDNDPTLTKTFKYMFGIELSLYTMTNIEKAFEKLNPYFLNEKWDKMNVYLDDVQTKDYSLEEQADSEQPVYIYHIKVDTRNSDFNNIIDVIKTSSSYIDCYQCKDVDCNYAIIRYKVNVNRRIPHLLNSKYSLMYNKQEIESIKSNQYIKTRYVKSEGTGFATPILVLSRDDEAFNDICDRLGITDDETMSIMKQNEYDSKINLSKEIINSKELC